MLKVPLKLIQMARFSGNVLHPVHIIRIIEGGVEESINIFHEGSSHFPFALVFRLRRGNKIGFLTLLWERRFFLWGKWGLGPSDEEDKVLMEEEGWLRGERWGGFLKSTLLESVSRRPLVATSASISGAINILMSQMIAIGTKSWRKRLVEVSAKLSF